MRSQYLNGVFTAIFTPLLSDDPKRLRNSIDYDKAKIMINDLIEKGVDGVVPVGTTGQSATLSHKQHLDFIRFVVETVAGRCKIIAGAGSNCTRESVDMILDIQKIAKIPVLCVTGYYNNPSEDGLFLHFKTLAEETKAEIVLYNVPSRTNSYLTPNTIIELAQIPNVIGLKQAVDFTEGGEHRADTLEILSETKEIDFAVISGEDDGFLQLLKDGGKGVISATANIPEAAQLFLDVAQNLKENKLDLAQSSQTQLNSFVEMVFLRKSPMPLAHFFNSDIYQPLSPIVNTPAGEEAVQKLNAFSQSFAPSLLKYQK